MTAGRRSAHHSVSGIGQNRLNISSLNHFAFKLSIYVPSSLFEQKRMFLIPSRKLDCLKLALDPAGNIPAPQCFSDEFANKGQLRCLSMSSLWLLNSSREINMLVRIAANLLPNL